jgi:formylmethanofuran dehydrogenase subunit E
MNPRKHIVAYIEKNDTAALLDLSVQMHGHYCPGIALGVMAAQFAMKEMKIRTDGLEDFIAITETNNCFSDGVQFVTGCSFGNNALIFNDLGKTAFSLVDRKGNGIRVATLPSSRDYIRTFTKEFTAKYKKVVKEQDRTKQEKNAFKKYGKLAAHKVLTLDFYQIFKTDPVQASIPDYAPSHESFLCESCQETIMSSRVQEINNKYYCLDCSQADYMQLSGFGIQKINKTK